MKIYLFLLLFVIFFSCKKNVTQKIYPPSPEWELADEIYDNEIGKKVFSQLRKEKKLQVCESGWALLGKKKIQVMHCGFFYYDELNIDQARELLLAAGNLYLAAINENERIRHLLGTYPFRPENIEIRIFLYNRDRSIPSSEKLQVISMIDGILEYENRSAETKFLTTIYTETYAEAIAKLSNVTTINPTRPLYNLSEASVIANEIQKKVIFQLKVEKDLYPCEFGGGAKNPIKLLHCGFHYYNEIDIERSRELLFFSANKFLEEINLNEKIRPYLAIYPFKPENIEISIFLYNQDGSKLSPEKLHVIIMKNGILEYMIAGAENELLPTIYKETYYEASEKLNNASFSSPDLDLYSL